MGELTRISEMLNGAEYIEILEEVIFPSVRSLQPAFKVINKLVQDNCPNRIFMGYDGQ